MFQRSLSKAQYLDILRLNFALFHRARTEGLMSLEAMVEEPDHPSTLFAEYPALRDYPEHFDYLRDLLRLMIAGNLEEPILRLYHDTATTSFRRDGGEHEPLWNLIWTFCIASAQGLAPQVAAEFARRAIPQAQRPGFVELEDALREVSRHRRKDASAEDVRQSINDELDRLMGKQPEETLTPEEKNALLNPPTYKRG